MEAYVANPNYREEHGGVGVKVSGLGARYGVKRFT